MTPNKEDYLKCIFELNQEGQKLSNKQIAERMAVSPPAVSEMMKKMTSEGLVIRDSQLGYQLTSTGLTLVAALYRKHRLLEVFLVNHLNYTDDEIHEEAEVLEHTVSDHFIDRLEVMLGHPKFCPHGGTIPEANQLLTEIYHTRLTEIKTPGQYQLVRIQDDMQLRKYMATHQLKVSDIIQFLGYDDFAQTYHIQIQGQDIFVTDTIARYFYLEKVETNKEPA